MPEQAFGMALVTERTDSIEADFEMTSIKHESWPLIAD